jgi:hypothetical protein
MMAWVSSRTGRSAGARARVLHLVTVCLALAASALAGYTATLGGKIIHENRKLFTPAEAPSRAHHSTSLAPARSFSALAATNR